jgi:GTP-binding protein
MHGKDGTDLIIDLPVGSVVTDLRTVATGGPGGVKKGEGRKINLLTEGELIRILKGGNGGLGNEHFKASTNVRPTEHTDGKPGEEGDFVVELELLADAGFVGLPNAGKSSLLNALTNTNVKVGSYQFTTLEPNLGALRSFILADIPGLIEGASEGKGLGHRFLRHVKRTKMLFHLISLENIHGDDFSGLATVYNTIRKELEQYGQGLAEKPEIIILTKTDVFGTDQKTITKGITKAKKFLKKKNILSVTILDDASVKALGDEIIKQLRVA